MKSSKVLIPPSNKKWTIVCLLLAGLSLGIGLSLAILSSLDRLAKDSVRKAPEISAPNNTASNETLISPPVIPEVQPPKDLLIDESKKAEIVVKWHDPVYLNDKEIGDFFGVVLSHTSSSGEVFHEVLFKRLWKAGFIQGGEYDGMEVYMLNYAVVGMGEDDYFQHAIRSNDGKIYAINGSPMFDQDLWMNIANTTIGSKIISYPNVEILDLFVPDKLLLNGKNIYRTEISFFPNNVSRYDLDQDSLQKVGTASGGFDVYIYKKDPCLYIFSADGTAYTFSSRIPFKKDDSGSDDILQPDVSWSVKGIDYGSFEYRTLGGCGASGCANVVSEDLVKPDSLVVAGKASDGTSIYTPKDPITHPIVIAQYDGWYSSSFVEDRKPSIEQFLKLVKTPVFFWKDALGRWVQYTSTNAVGMVECGKPVIYLYPTTTTEVNVKLPSFINVTVSDPQYPINGWNVIASSSGLLISKDDGKMYGSLYWEGTGVGYQMPKTGFIVKDGEVASFFAKTLPKYGLNPTEAREFMEFWVPRMTGAPYYQISFLTNEWSRSAPLNVTPRPQTSIRIFMDWKPLSKARPIKAPVIVTPARNGFTLVEWGGLLYK